MKFCGLSFEIPKPSHILDQSGAPYCGADAEVRRAQYVAWGPQAKMLLRRGSQASPGNLYVVRLRVPTSFASCSE